MFAQKRHGIVADRVGVVIRVGLIMFVVLGRDKSFAAAERRGVVERASAGDRAVVLVKTAGERPVVARCARACPRGDVPFSAHVGAITAARERLGDCWCMAMQITGISR